MLAIINQHEMGKKISILQSISSECIEAQLQLFGFFFSLQTCMSLFSWLFSESGNSRGVERGKNTGEGNFQKSRHYDLHPNEQVSAQQTGSSVVLAAEGGKA